MVVTCALMDGPHRALTLAVSHSCLIDPNSFVLWKTLGGGAQSPFLVAEQIGH